MAFFRKKPPFIWSANTSGLAIRFSDARSYEKARDGRGTETDQMAFIRMQMLLESGEVETEAIDCGIFIASDDAVRLDRDTRECFALPEHWPGGFRLRTTSVPQHPNFTAEIELVNSDHVVCWDWKVRGPILEVDGVEYLPTAVQYAALKAYLHYHESPEKDEYVHLGFLATLQEAKSKGLLIHLETYEKTTVAEADELFIDVREEESSGDLLLRPVVSGNFSALNPDELEKRFAQFQSTSNRVVVRVGQTVVLLTPEQTEQAKAVIARNRISQFQRKAFENNPSAWLAEHIFSDIDIEFSPRVTGVGHWTTKYLGVHWETSEDWFGKKPEPSKTADEKKVHRPQPSDQELGSKEAYDDRPIVPLIIPNDKELEYGWPIPKVAGDIPQAFQIDYSRYGLRPYPHQEEAVRWLLWHARRALHASTSTSEKGYGAGALLADDMGLGKTFSALIAIAEWFELWRSSTKTEPPPLLIVAPLSLMENWKRNVSIVFGQQL